MNGLFAVGLGCAFYLVDCFLAPEERRDVFWLARGVYAMGPAGFAITLMLLGSGLGLTVFYALKLLLKKEADPDRQRTTRGM